MAEPSKTDSVIITGASRGIGRAIANSLADAHYALALHSSQSLTSNQEWANSRNLSPHRAFSFASNLQQLEALESSFAPAISWAQSEDRQLSGLVLNAGITLDKLHLRLTIADMQQIFSINLMAPAEIARLVSRVLMKNRRGSILLMSSVIAHHGNAGQSAYAASKGALESLTRSLAKELGPRNIRVNTIAPGFIETDMTASLTDEQKDAILRQVPLSRMGQAHEVAKLAKFLISEDASYCTGSTFHINGGMWP